MTLAEWKRRLKVGQKLVCTYRWYWDRPAENPKNFRPAPVGGEPITIVEIHTTQLVYSTPTAPRSWMQFPKASELKATDSGFELYFPVNPALSSPANGPDRSGKLMSRYEYVSA